MSRVIKGAIQCDDVQTRNIYNKYWMFDLTSYYWFYTSWENIYLIMLGSLLNILCHKHWWWWYEQMNNHWYMQTAWQRKVLILKILVETAVRKKNMAWLLSPAYALSLLLKCCSKKQRMGYRLDYSLFIQNIHPWCWWAMIFFWFCLSNCSWT